jgi:two-component system, cell cycle response regulator DivK
VRDRHPSSRYRIRTAVHIDARACDGARLRTTSRTAFLAQSGCYYYVPILDLAIEETSFASALRGATTVLTRPDLVLMDIQLPVIDGYDATQQIEALPGLGATPIIAVSSFAMKGDEEKARAAGCDHYVTKRYSPIQLLRIIRGFLPEQA